MAEADGPYPHGVAVPCRRKALEFLDERDTSRANASRHGDTSGYLSVELVDVPVQPPEQGGDCHHGAEYPAAAFKDALAEFDMRPETYRVRCIGHVMGDAAGKPFVAAPAQPFRPPVEKAGAAIVVHHSKAASISASEVINSASICERT